MSDKPYYRFELGINRDPAAPSMEVKDLTGQGRPYSERLPRAEFPIALVIGRARGAGHDVGIHLLPDNADPGPCCDPCGGADDQILAVRGYVAEYELDTYDDARYILQITNTSRRFAAEQISVQVRISGPTDPDLTLPDDNILISMVPPEQLIRCIDPGAQKDLAFLIVTRGARHGRYIIHVTLTYQLVLTDRPVSEQRARVELPVGIHDGDDEPPSSDDPCCSKKKPPAKRNKSMPIQYGPKGQPSSHAQPHRPPPAVQNQQPSVAASGGAIDPATPHKIPLPGRGFLVVSYRLYKGRRSDWDDDPCCSNVNPRDLEVYFSSQDTAALGLSFRNDSTHFLRHVHATDIRLYYADHCGSQGNAVDATLPDGSPLFEVIPGDVYYGHIGPQERRIKYLGLVTRGVQPGLYLVHMDIRYELEHCGVALDLGLRVHAD